MRWLSRHSLAVNRAAGVLLIVLGALIVTGRLAAIAAFLVRHLPLSVG